MTSFFKVEIVSVFQSDNILYKIHRILSQFLKYECVFLIICTKYVYLYSGYAATAVTLVMCSWVIHTLLYTGLEANLTHGSYAMCHGTQCYDTAYDREL